MSATYYYFKPSGKWKYSGEGVSIPMDGKEVTHQRIWELNGGSYPGINSTLEGGNLYIVVVIDPDSFPRLVHNLREWI